MHVYDEAYHVACFGGAAGPDENYFCAAEAEGELVLGDGGAVELAGGEVERDGGGGGG